MNREKIFESLSYIDDDLLLRSEAKERKWSFNMLLKPVAALAVIILAVFIVVPRGGGFGMKSADSMQNSMPPEVQDSVSFEKKVIANGYDSYLNEQTGLVTYVETVTDDHGNEVSYESVSSYSDENGKMVNQVFVSVNDVLYRVYNYADDCDIAISDINYVVDHYLKDNQ